MPTRDERVLSALPYVKGVVASFKVCGDTFEELEAQAMLLLIGIATKFSPERHQRGEDGWIEHAKTKLRFDLAHWIRTETGERYSDGEKTKIKNASKNSAALDVGYRDTATAQPWEEADVRAMKGCPECKRLLPANTSNFYVRKGYYTTTGGTRVQRTGLSGWCKDCRKRDNRIRNSSREGKARVKNQRRSIDKRKRKYISAHAKLKRCWYQARYRLTKVVCPKRQSRLQELITRYETELRRMEGPTPTDQEMKALSNKIAANRSNVQNKERNRNTNRETRKLLDDQIQTLIKMRRRAAQSY